MPRHPHPPLRELLQHVQQDDEVWLLAVPKSGRQGWKYGALQSLESAKVWLYVSMALSNFLAFWGAVLCMVRTKVEMQDVDTLVDVLVQRLSIRRSGSRLLVLSRGAHG